MKTIRNLLLGLTALSLIAAVSITNATVLHKKKADKKAKKAQVDQYEGVFLYSSTPVSGRANYYDIVVYFAQYDINTNTLYPVNSSPTNFSITITSGPYSGTSFPYSQGIASQDLGQLYFSSNPSGTNFSATITPNSVAGIPIAQELASHVP